MDDPASDLDDDLEGDFVDAAEGGKIGAPVLRAAELTVQVATPEGPKTVVDRFSFELNQGETLCLVGESGSGKSMTALALMGLLPRPMARITGGSVHLNGRDILSLSEGSMSRLRSSRIGMIFQEPMTSLNPLMTIGRQLREVLAAHKPSSVVGRPGDYVHKLLEDVKIPNPERRVKQYPHEISGGMRQRVMIAMAMACEPGVLIADEPTTALDVTVQAEILALIRDLQARHGTAVLLITHDMAVVAQTADRVVVMQGGRKVEEAGVLPLFSSPREPYTRALLAAVPRLGAGRSGTAKDGESQKQESILSVHDLTVRFDIRSGLLHRIAARVYAVEKVSFSIPKKKTIALVGESGCGKSTLAKALLGLVPWNGVMEVNGIPVTPGDPRGMGEVRRNIQMVFQDSGSSLDPRMRVGEQAAEPMRVHGIAGGTELRDRAAYLFRRVHLPVDFLSRYPHELSGGQRQRVCIARALSLSPRLIIADESVSALDVSIQAQVLELLQELQDESDLSYLFISHDMAVVDQIADEVMVMYLGRIVERGSCAAVLHTPAHSYTRKLLAAVPVPDPRERRGFAVAAAGAAAPASVGSPIHPLGELPEPALLVTVGLNHQAALEK